MKEHIRLNKLIKMRLKSGYTLEIMSSKLGITQGYYSMLERGFRSEDGAKGYANALTIIKTAKKEVLTPLTP